MNLSRPCHDPHRTDAVLACMADALHDIAGEAEADDDSPDTSDRGADMRALADAVEGAVDRVALLGLLPLTGRDEVEGSGLASIATGRAKASDYAEDDRALAAVVAVRLAAVAASTVARTGKPDLTASALWAASGCLTGLLTHTEARLASADECMRLQAADLSRTEVERDELRRELEQARAEVTDLRAEADAARAVVARLQKYADGLRIERDARACQANDLAARLEEGQRELAKVTGVADELRRVVERCLLATYGMDVAYDVQDACESIGAMSSWNEDRGGHVVTWTTPALAAPRPPAATP